jgi:hypothetical protein
VYCTGKQNGVCQDKSSPLLNHRSRAEYIEIKESLSENNIKTKTILLEVIESRGVLSVVRELIDSAITWVTSKFCGPRDLDENLDEMLNPFSGVFFRLP